MSDGILYRTQIAGIGHQFHNDVLVVNMKKVDVFAALQ